LAEASRSDVGGEAARVLFVDDEPHVLTTMRRTLAEDFDVHTAESGATRSRCSKGTNRSV